MLKNFNATLYKSKVHNFLHSLTQDDVILASERDRVVRGYIEASFVISYKHFTSMKSKIKIHMVMHLIATKQHFSETFAVSSHFMHGKFSSMYNFRAYL